MPARMNFLFLHGVGRGDIDNNWQTVLGRTLHSIGYPRLENINIIAPKYAFALRGVDDKSTVPKITVKDLSGNESQRKRREFELRTSGLELALGSGDGGTGNGAADFVVSAAVRVPWFEQAKNYLQNENIRAVVLTKILEHIPEEGRLVIVGHSLGSVIAADLLKRLPPKIEVVGMVTIGSPLSQPDFDIASLKKQLKNPPANLGWWANFWNTLDPVTAKRGLSEAFPWILDQKIQVQPNLITAHNAQSYLEHSNVAKAIGFALYGSLSKEIAVQSREVELSLSGLEMQVAIALRFSFIIEDQLKGEIQQRYKAARRLVQNATVDAFMRRSQEENILLHPSISMLGSENSDLNSPTPTPQRVTHVFKNEAVGLVLSIATSNEIRPFEIDVSPKIKDKALKTLCIELGLGAQFGVKTIEALDKAQKITTPKNSSGMFKWAALGVGAAALVIGTGGLALAAAPGLAGAAAITSALAAFGPGGMVGGLITAGSFVGAGGGSIAAALVSSTTTSQSVEAVVTTQLAAAILRNSQNLEQDPAVWEDLNEISSQIQREYSRALVISDSSSQSVKELKKKAEIVKSAIDFLSREIFVEPKNIN